MALALSKRADRAAIGLIAVTAALASALEATVLVIVTLTGLRLSTEAASPVDLPFGLPLDELSTGKLLVTAAGCLVLRIIAGSANVWGTARLSESILVRWRKRVIDAYTATSWERQRQEQDGHLQTVVQTYVGGLSDVATQLGSSVTALVSFSTFVAGAFALHPLAALGLFLIGTMMAMMLRPMTARVRRLARETKVEGQEFARVVGELVNTVTEVVTFGRQEQVRTRMNEPMRRQAQARHHQAMARGITPMLIQTMGLGVVLLGLAVAAQLKLGDAALVGALVLLLIRSLGYGQTLLSNWQAMAGSEPAVRGVIDAVERYEGDRPEFGTTEVESLEALVMTQAQLGYTDAAIVKPLTLRIERGESIGIVGPSGAGKSTLAAGLLGLIPPTAGTYVVGDTGAASISRASWSRLVAYVPQEPKLIEGSVSDNIGFFRPATQDAIETAARKAHLGHELASWDDGLSHQVGPRGVWLSGGQKQRICVARALLGEPELLVLDEPTSALDGDAEDAIGKVLRDLKGTCTIVIIAHRLTTLEFCDRILHVQDGVVVEIGTGREVATKRELRQRLLEASVIDDIVDHGARA